MQGSGNSLGHAKHPAYHITMHVYAPPLSSSQPALVPCSTAVWKVATSSTTCVSRLLLESYHQEINCLSAMDPVRSKVKI